MISRANLLDKDIRNLKVNSRVYKRAVGNPAELYIKIYSSGIKTFILKVADKEIKLDRFREGVFSVKEARELAKEN